MKVLFIARTYPPVVGGMQKFASDFYNNFNKLGDIDLIANRGGNRMMVFFVLKLIFFLALNSKKYNIVHFSDAMLSPLMPIIRAFSGARVSFTVHGLDIVYSRFGYQKIIIPFLKRADKIFSVSEFSKEQCIKRGILRDKLTTIPNCLNFESLNSDFTPDRSAITSKFKIDANNKRILLTVGRLIKRKGHAWFISNVFPNLPTNYIYVIAGLGPEYDTIKDTAQRHGLSDRVYLLGYVSEEEKKHLYQISDLFIMPNVEIAGDQEGFGIVLLEAGRYGLPVVASNIEGIKDAVIDGKTGHLVDEKDVNGFVNAIVNPDIDTTSIKENVISAFDCSNIIKTYFLEFRKLCGI